MNDLVPTNVRNKERYDYKIWYDSLCRGIRIKTKEGEYFIPDNRMIDVDVLILKSTTELEQFKVK